jgi:hypothetical protein
MDERLFEVLVFLRQKVASRTIVFARNTVEALIVVMVREYAGRGDLPGTIRCHARPYVQAARKEEKSDAQ